MKTYLSDNSTDEKSKNKQFSTFIIDGRLYGVDVMNVQEVTMPMQVTMMRTAPAYIKGVINLRGQITTAIGLRELFNLATDPSLDKMTVVCHVEDVLISLLVDSIGDVVEVSSSAFEPTPQTIQENIKCHMDGVYKMDDGLLSVLNLKSILKDLDKRCA